MTLSKTSDYIACKCGCCSDVTGHVVMLVLDGEISKVECKACGSVHKYRESKTAKPRSQQSSVRRVRAGQSREQALEVRPRAQKRHIFGRDRPLDRPRFIPRQLESA